MYFHVPVIIIGSCSLLVRYGFVLYFVCWWRASILGWKEILLIVMLVLLRGSVSSQWSCKSPTLIIPLLDWHFTDRSFHTNIYFYMHWITQVYRKLVVVWAVLLVVVVWKICKQKFIYYNSVYTKRCCTVVFHLLPCLQLLTMHDFRLLPQSKWELRSSGLLRSK